MDTKMKTVVLGDRGPNYIFRDEFSDTRAAGEINNTKTTDGRATRTVVDTEDKLTISGGKLVCAGGKASPAYGNPGLWYGEYAKAIGLALIGKLTPVNASGVLRLGFDSDQSSATAYDNIRLDSSGNLTSSLTTNYIGTYSAVEMILCVVLVENLAHLIVKSGGIWKLLIVQPIESGAAVYPAVTNYNLIVQTDYLRLAQLPAPFNTDYGIATQRLAGARSAGDTFVHEADCLIGWTVTTLPSNNGMMLAFRSVDANNEWYLQVNSAGAASLIEYAAGGFTIRGNLANGSITTGCRLVFIADNETIKLYVNGTLKLTYTSASNFKTAMTGRVRALGTGGAVSDIVSWPRNLSGTAASILEKYAR